jgi:hypothetical protein
MLGCAQSDPAVLRSSASVSPENLASRRLVAGLGLIEVGSQWDEQDGEETMFETGRRSGLLGGSHRLMTAGLARIVTWTPQ